MKARICFNETGTGEPEMFDTEIDDLSLESVVDAMMRYQKHTSPADAEDLMAFKGEAFVLQGTQAAFILSSCDDVWFGDMLWHGVVYTVFAGEADINVPK